MPNPADPRILQPSNPLELHITVGVPFQFPMYTDRDGRDVFLDEMVQHQSSSSSSAVQTNISSPLGILRGHAVSSVAPHPLSLQNDASTTQPHVIPDSEGNVFDWSGINTRDTSQPDKSAPRGSTCTEAQAGLDPC